jgi:hypothetical protein
LRRFEVVRVPFLFTDRQAGKNRPALIFSNSAAFSTKPDEKKRGVWASAPAEQLT